MCCDRCNSILFRDIFTYRKGPDAHVETICTACAYAQGANSLADRYELYDVRAVFRSTLIGMNEDDELEYTARGLRL